MKLKNILGLSASLAIMAASFWLFTNQQAITDWWRLRDFEPTPEISQLVVDSGMSQEGERLFFIHSPELLDKSQFNGKCDIGEETIILGCYISNDKIYVFNVEDERLDGIEEVTAAHEMLHAVYDRLSESEKAELEPLLLRTFRELNDERLNKTIEAYRSRDPSVVPNELHSILGSEIRELPIELEEYYKEYFDDRLKVVSLAEAYEETFVNLENEIKSIRQKIDELDSTIKMMEQDIVQLGSAIEQERILLEQKRGNPSEFNAGVPTFNALVRDYNNKINEVKSLVNQHNDLVTKHNELALIEQDLIQSIDSNFIEL